MDPRDEALRLDHQLCFPLYACARKVTQAYTPFLKPLGLTYTQYLVMLVLWESDGLRVTELCERLYLDTGTLTPVLKKMEQAGLLDRRRSVQDERQVEGTGEKYPFSDGTVHVHAAGRCGESVPDSA